MATYIESSDFPYIRHDAITLTAGDIFEGALRSPSGQWTQDIDWIPVLLDSNYSYLFELGTNLYRRGINIIDPTGTKIAQAHNAVSLASQGGDGLLRFTPSSTDIYYIEVWNFTLGNDPYNEGDYSVKVIQETADNIRTTEQITFNYSGKAVGQYQGTREYIEDYDYVRGTFEAGRTYVITYSDDIDRRAYFWVTDENGTAIRADNGAYTEVNDRFAFTPSQTGTYYIVTELSHNAGSYSPEALIGNKAYEINVESEAPDSFATQYVMTPDVPLIGTADFINDVDVYKVNLEAGKSYLLQGTAGSFTSIMLLDSTGNRLDSTSKETWNARSYHVVTPATSGTYYVYIKPNSVNSTAYQALITTEIAGDPSTSTKMSIGETLKSSFEFAGDEDVIALDVLTGVPYKIIADIDGLSSERINIDVIDASGNRLINTGGYDTDTKEVEFTPVLTETVYLKVKGLTGGLDYSLSVVPDGTTPDDGDGKGDGGDGSGDGTGSPGTVTGTNSGDTLTSGPDDETIDAGNGTDTIKYDATLGDTTITRNDDGTILVDASQSGQGTDTLINVERLTFTDGTIAFDTDAGENAGSAYRVYQAAFARTPDNDGLKFWIGQVDNGTSLYDVARGFLGSLEFQSIYGTNPTNQAFVAKLYENVLGREGEATGIAFWVGELNNGTRDKATILTQFSESPENISGVSGAISDGIWLL